MPPSPGAWALIGYHDLLTDRTDAPSTGGTRDRLADWMLAHLPAGFLLQAHLRRAGL